MSDRRLESDTDAVWSLKRARNESERQLRDAKWHLGEKERQLRHWQGQVRRHESEIEDYSRAIRALSYSAPSDEDE